jgi:hypothetical protein
MFGASMFVGALVFGLISSQRVKIIILSLLVGLSVGNQYRIGNEYRWDWEMQRRAYWQMYWRMPGLTEDASLMIDGALTTYANRYSSGMAVNLLYGQAEEGGDLYLFDYFANNINWAFEEIVAGKTLTTSMRGAEFEFNLDSSVFIIGPDRAGQCIWVLNARDRYYSMFPDEIRDAIPYLDLDNILPEPTNDAYPPSSIFGPEAPHGWCYYFQKADLARQYADWETVLELEETARQNNYTTLHGYELLPFLEAHFALEQWSEAGRLIKEIDRLEKDNIRDVVCSMWFDYLPADRETAEFLEAQSVLENLFVCSTWVE